MLAQCNIFPEVGTMAKDCPHSHVFLFYRETADFCYIKANIRMDYLQPLSNDLNLYSNDEPIAN